MPTFLDLPREIRDMVYTYALPSYEYQSLNAHHTLRHRFPFPTITSQLALLLVSRQVNVEASHIFYNQNRFRIPTTREDFHLLMGRHKQEIRHVTVIFYHDLEKNDPRCRPSRKSPKNFNYKEEDQLHDFITQELEAHARLQLHHLRALPNLRSVVFDWGSIHLPEWMSLHTLMEDILFEGLLHALGEKKQWRWSAYLRQMDVYRRLPQLKVDVKFIGVTDEVHALVLKNWNFHDLEWEGVLPYWWPK